MTASMFGDDKPITALEARGLFAPFASAPAIAIAVSGGPDSTALLWLAARWRKTRRRGPKLIAVTIDHGLRKESAAEARAVKRLAAALNIAHVTKRWRGEKPRSGIPAAARAARYRLLQQAAASAKATHILTAHTRDDQAETVLMRLARGSGLTGLAAMADVSPSGAVLLARPFLAVPKARLIATLDRAKIAFATDPTNADPAYLRPRLRSLLPRLAAEGLDAQALTRFATRMARADVALKRMTDATDLEAFREVPCEVQIRLVQRAIAEAGHEGSAGLGQIEALVDALNAALKAGKPLRRTLAGALISLAGGRLTVTAAPPRRASRR